MGWLTPWPADVANLTPLRRVIVRWFETAMLLVEEHGGSRTRARASSTHFRYFPGSAALPSLCSAALPSVDSGTVKASSGSEIPWW